MGFDKNADTWRGKRGHGSPQASTFLSYQNVLQTLSMGDAKYKLLFNMHNLCH